MHRFFVLLLFTSLSLVSCGQRPLRKAVQQHVYKVGSLTSADQTDLQALARAIRDARVVLLGEQDHGDATTFEAKTRIVEYLHQNLGFDVLAFESDFFALTEGWKTVRTADDLSRLVEGNLFAIWSQCRQFSGLTAYLLRSYQRGTPLELTGFDVQLHGRHSQAHFGNWLTTFLRERKLFDRFEKDLNTPLASLLDSVLYHSKRQTAPTDTAVLKRLGEQLARVEMELAKQGLSTEYEMQVVESLRSQVQVMLSRKGNHPRSGLQERDRQMADNLYWLVTQRYAGRKVIVWAASYHTYGAPFEKTTHYYFPNRFYPMGYLFRQRDTTLPVYSLGFTSYAGSAQRIGGSLYTFKSGERNSLEQWVQDENAEYAFVDLEQVSASVGKKQTFLMAGAGHFQIRQNWMEGFNGVYFIRNMNPCQRNE